MVRLADNRIGAEGARAVGDALKANTTLTELLLGSEQQDHKQTQESEASAMTRGVADRQRDLRIG